MKILQFILSHSIFISICAAALCLQANILLHLPHNLNIYGFILCSTLCSYNFYWLLSKFYFSNRIVSLAFVKRHFSFMLLFTLAGAGMIFFLLRIWDLLPYIVGGICLTLLYSLPLWPLPISKKLQKAGFFKTTLLALTWAYVTTILPAARVLHTETAPVLALLTTRFCFMLLLCTIFDMRDISVDKMHGLRSLATDLSKRTLSVIINIVFICFFISGLLVRFYFHDNLQMVFFLLTGIITFFVYRLSLKPRGYIFYYFLVDGLMLISAAGTWIAAALQSF
jgi:hypothetical protein